MDEKSVNKMFSGLSPEQQEQVRRILSDEKRTREILNTPQAQMLMKKLTGDGKNG